jgi:hypothetical protein
MGDSPIACTLSTDELRASASSLLPGVISRARRVTTRSNGIRVELEATSDNLRRLADAIERERQCCAFLHFELDVPPNAGAYILTVTGPDGSERLFDDLTALAQTTNATTHALD